jgi:hypothetical protein
MSTPAFFALLTKHVAPQNLETLMHALGVFNAGKIGKPDLLGVAEQTLRLPPGHGPGIDLVATFKALILRQ